MQSEEQSHLLCEAEARGAGSRLPARPMAPAAVPPLGSGLQERPMKVKDTSTLLLAPPGHPLPGLAAYLLPRTAL